MKNTVGGDRDQLHEKYLSLCKKYEELVHKYEALSAHRMAQYQLAWWALRTFDTGLAILRDGALIVSNARWDELARTKGTVRFWRLADGAEVRCSTAKRRHLREVLAEAAVRLAEEHATRIVASFERDDGARTIDLRVERLEHPSEVPVVAALAVDVTEQVRVQRELDRASEALAQQERMHAIGELASGVAHDLNNTLNALGLRVAVLQKDPDCMRAQRESIDVIARVAADAAEMVGRLQDFARQRHDRPLESLDVGAAVRDAAALIRPELERSALGDRTIALAVSIAPSLPPVPGVASELRHVLVNLLLNARDAMAGRSGTIHMSAFAEGDQVVVAVEDEGAGILPENMTRIFNPFFTTKGGRGTGLGLSMAWSVMNRLGGGITADNREGGGAVFRLHFPKVRATEAAMEAVAAEPTAPSSDFADGVRARRILIVDDDVDNLDAMREVLALEGQAVEVAASGREAIDRFEAGEHYDLVLSDVGMPEVSGWEVAKTIHDLAPETQVYLITGWAREIPEDDPRRAIVTGVLSKPLELDRIRRLIGASPDDRPRRGLAH